MDPTPYLTAHVPHFLGILAGIFLADVIVAAIPDRVLPAGSTAQLVVLVARSVLGAVLRALGKAPAAVLLVLLLASPAYADDPFVQRSTGEVEKRATPVGDLLARADDPPVLPPTRAPVTAPQLEQPPPAALDPRVPLVCPPVQAPQFADTTAGKVLTYVSAIGAGLVSASAAVSSVMATWPR